MLDQNGCKDLTQIGNPYGDREAGCLFDLFRKRDGYTSLSLVLALLVSLTLVFSAAAAQWALSQGSHVQQVADSCALSASSVTSKYTTAAQVLDACVLSLGIVASLTMGAGFIVSCVPGGSGVGSAIVDCASKLFDVRQKFADSAQEGLLKFENVLPGLIMLNAKACAQANSQGDKTYSAAVLPFPLTSKSEFKLNEHDVDVKDLEDHAKQIQKASDEVEQYQKAADDAKYAGWLADCGNAGYNMFERAGKLAGLSQAENPYYADWHAWSFAAPILRARAYYAKRIQIEAPEATNPEEITRSKARKQYYIYALKKVQEAFVKDSSEGVKIHLPSLAKNTEEIKATELYTERSWPLYRNGDSASIHSYTDCPGAQGSLAGVISLADAESLHCVECSVCKMSTEAQGKVASASTSIENGFEHWWQKEVEAAQAYQKATEKLAQYEKELSKATDDASGGFDKALNKLEVNRAKWCPPGAYGCIAVVRQSEGRQVPSELTRSFLSEVKTDPTCAISGSCLAPDSDEDAPTVLGAVEDSLSQALTQGEVNLGICEAWGRCLAAYGSSYEKVSDVAENVFSGLENIGAGSVADKLRNTLSDLVKKTGFAPVDMRMRKPVLVNTQEILSKAGYSKIETARKVIQALPDQVDPAYTRLIDLAKEFIQQKSFTIAELPFLDSDRSIPLTVDTALGGG